MKNFNELNLILSRLKEPRRFIQVLSGPRQVGKTTIAQQIINNIKVGDDRLIEIGVGCHYASADDPSLKDLVWIEQQWNIARGLINKENKSAILILDEVQKLSKWSEIVKKLWDEDSWNKTNLYLILLGSSPLLLHDGLNESLAGRFETIPITHWSYSKMKSIFNYSLEQYIFFGGYPGAAELIQDQDRWKNYIRNSLIETTISRDVLLVTKVDKPVLLRRLFDLACIYSSKELSYQKMTGQLQDAGNTTTLAHYLNLLQQVGLIAGLNKFAGEEVRKRASSPKLQVFNTALISSNYSESFEQIHSNTIEWGRLVESAVGAHILNSAILENFNVFYWRDGKYEVDFVLQKGKKLIALEVKSTARVGRLAGLAQFEKQFGATKKILVGQGGITIESFLLDKVGELFAI